MRLVSETNRCLQTFHRTIRFRARPAEAKAASGASRWSVSKRGTVVFPARVMVRGSTRLPRTAKPEAYGPQQLLAVPQPFLVPAAVAGLTLGGFAHALRRDRWRRLHRLKHGR